MQKMMQSNIARGNLKEKIADNLQLEQKNVKSCLPTAVLELLQVEQLQLAGLSVTEPSLTQHGWP